MALNLDLLCPGTGSAMGALAAAAQSTYATARLANTAMAGEHDWGGGRPDGGTMAFVGKVSDVAAGQLVGIEVDGTPVAVANVDGRLFAIGDECTHRGCSLAEGELTGTIVTCPCHGGQFDVTSGRVVSAPPSEPAPVYDVQIVGDEFRIG